MQIHARNLIFVAKQCCKTTLHTLMQNRLKINLWKNFNWNVILQVNLLFSNNLNLEWENARLMNEKNAWKWCFTFVWINCTSDVSKIRGKVWGCLCEHARLALVEQLSTMVSWITHTPINIQPAMFNVRRCGTERDVDYYYAQVSKRWHFDHLLVMAFWMTTIGVFCSEWMA